MAALDNESLKDQKEMWQAFMQHPCWKSLEEIIQGQVANRKGLIFSPLESHDAVLGQEYLKGEAAFGELVLALPATCLEQVQVEIDKAKAQDPESNSQGDKE